jgi:hypothetical protein
MTKALTHKKESLWWQRSWCLIIALMWIWVPWRVMGQNVVLEGGAIFCGQIAFSRNTILNFIENKYTLDFSPWKRGYTFIRENEGNSFPIPTSRSRLVYLLLKTAKG